MRPVPSLSRDVTGDMTTSLRHNISPALLSDSQSRVRRTLLWVFVQFCQFHMCTIQEQSRGKSFLERFLKKIDFSPTGKVVVIQILVSCIDSFFDSILLFYAKFPFI